LSDERIMILGLDWLAGHRYRVRLQEGAKGSAEFVFPSSTWELQDLRRFIEGTIRNTLNAADSRHGRLSPRGLDGQQTTPPLEFGQRLSSTVFAGQVVDRFRVEQGVAVTSRSRCRLTVRVDPGIPELARLMVLPWELLTDPENGEFLLPDRRWPIVRSLDVRWPHRPAPPAATPLNLLIFSAQPRGLPALAVDEEVRRIQAACAAHQRIQVEPVFGTTVEALQRHLDEANLLHFIGHGGVDSISGEGFLAFETESGRRRNIGAAELARLCRDLSGLRLVTLNACDTAVALRKDRQLNPFAGVATALIEQGIPAVIAMQWPISDRAGVRFAEALYARLSRTGDLLDAVETGRHAIRLGHPGSLEWATPVVFLHNQASVSLLEPCPHTTASGSAVEQKAMEAKPSVEVGGWMDMKLETARDPIQERGQKATVGVGRLLRSKRPRNRRRALTTMAVRRTVGMAAAILVSVGLTWTLAEQSELKHEQPLEEVTQPSLIATVDLLPSAVTRNSFSDPPIILRDRTTALLFSLSTAPPDYEYVLRAFGEAGEVVWWIDGLRIDGLEGVTVLVPARSLPVGLITMRIYTIEAGGNYLVQEYFARVIPFEGAVYAQ
jgi:hypothetical protein